jgi:hypothetical protein
MRWIVASKSAKAGAVDSGTPGVYQMRGRGLTGAAPRSVDSRVAARLESTQLTHRSLARPFDA